MGFVISAVIVLIVFLFVVVAGFINVIQVLYNIWLLFTLIRTKTDKNYLNPKKHKICWSRLTYVFYDYLPEYTLEKAKEVETKLGEFQTKFKVTLHPQDFTFFQAQYEYVVQTFYIRFNAFHA